MRYFEKIGKLNVREFDTLDLERQLKNPTLLDGPSQKDIEAELKRRRAILSYTKQEHPNLDISFNWIK
jgi:hypothetical protein